jgi:hypothetical protein
MALFKSAHNGNMVKTDKFGNMVKTDKLYSLGPTGAWLQLFVVAWPVEEGHGRHCCQIPPESLGQGGWWELNQAQVFFQI